jgi:magnesium transporter
MSNSRLDYFYHPPGTLPGKLDLDENSSPGDLVLIDYNQDSANRKQINDPEELVNYLETDSVSWLDVLGLGNEKTWSSLSRILNLHSMLVEDVVNIPQRPKVERYNHHILIIALMVTLKPDHLGFVKEQVSLILSKNYLLTIQEEPEFDCFQGVRDRIRHNQGIIRQHSTDYLAYCLLDAIIDGYFPVLEVYGELIEELEDEVILNPTRQTLEKIYYIRRELLVLRRAIWPQRDAINSLIRDHNDLISEEVQIYLRDCYDHTIQVMDMIENYRELSVGLMDVYMSSISNKMNDVMKLLTVISSIFIPLTFIAGVYGMNFNTDKSPWNMPELNWYWGYPLCLALMFTIAFGLILFFWHKGWFRSFSKLQ